MYTATDTLAKQIDYSLAIQLASSGWLPNERDATETEKAQAEAFNTWLGQYIADTPQAEDEACARWEDEEMEVVNHATSECGGGNEAIYWREYADGVVIGQATTTNWYSFPPGALADMPEVDEPGELGDEDRDPERPDVVFGDGTHLHIANALYVWESGNFGSADDLHGWPIRIGEEVFDAADNEPDKERLWDAIEDALANFPTGPFDPSELNK